MKIEFNMKENIRHIPSRRITKEEKKESIPRVVLNLNEIIANAETKHYDVKSNSPKTNSKITQNKLNKAIDCHIKSSRNQQAYTVFNTRGNDSGNR